MGCAVPGWNGHIFACFFVLFSQINPNVIYSQYWVFVVVGSSKGRTEEMFVMPFACSYHVLFFNVCARDLQRWFGFEGNYCFLGGSGGLVMVVIIQSFWQGRMGQRPACDLRVMAHYWNACEREVCVWITCRSMRSVVTSRQTEMLQFKAEITNNTEGTVPSESPSFYLLCSSNFSFPPPVSLSLSGDFTVTQYALVFPAAPRMGFSYKFIISNHEVMVLKDSWKKRFALDICFQISQRGWK